MIFSHILNTLMEVFIMAINEISDVAKNDGIVPKLAQSNLNDKSYFRNIARGVALFTALTVSSVLPYQVNANQSTSPEVNERVRKLEEEKKKAELKKQNEKPNQDFDILKTLEKNIDLKGENTKSTDTQTEKQEKKPAKKLSEEKSTDTPTEKKEKKSSSFGQWYDQTRAAGLDPHKNYIGLGLSGSHVAPSQGGVSGGNLRKGTMLEGVIVREFKKITLLPHSLSAKAAVLTEPDGSTDSTARLMPRYLFQLSPDKIFTLEPIGKFTGRNVSREDKQKTAEYEQNLRSLGARISLEFDKNTVIYLQKLFADGRYRLLPHIVSGGIHTQDTEGGLQLKLTNKTTLEAALRKIDTNYKGLQGEKNQDTGYGTVLRLAQGFGDKWFVGIYGTYNDDKFQADDRRIRNSVEVDSWKGGVFLGYRLTNNVLVAADVIKGHEWEGSFGLVWTPYSSGEKQKPSYSSSKKPMPPDSSGKKQRPTYSSGKK